MSSVYYYVIPIRCRCGTDTKMQRSRLRAHKTPSGGICRLKTLTPLERVQNRLIRVAYE